MMRSHADCDHPATNAARQRCNRSDRIKPKVHDRCHHPNTPSARHKCRMRDPEYRERMRAYHRSEEQRARDRERNRQRSRVNGANTDAYAQRLANNTKRRRQQAETQVEPICIDVLGERDNWTCHLCGNPVDPLLSGLDKWGPTRDHVTPASLGGDYTYENIKLAHRFCNTSKGNRYEVVL